MSKYSCPKCGANLSMTRTLDYDIDPDTGEVDTPMRDNFVHCADCDWDDNTGPLVSEIININIQKDLI